MASVIERRTGADEGLQGTAARLQAQGRANLERDLETGWIPTSCHMCNNTCGILVKVENGNVINVRGNPDSPNNQGRMCAKGKAGIMNHYNPDRVLRPLRRTNPVKGIGVDPMWEEISYEEAIDELTEQLRTILEDDPRKLFVQWYGDNGISTWLEAFRPVFGGHVSNGISPTCGKSIHNMQFFTTGGSQQHPDFHYCNYCILVGTQQGIATRESFMHQANACADARVRGMKLVVVDPMGNNAAAKADEWLPIRPGTDAAFALGMLNILLHELGIYDAEYLKHRTNAGYLVGSNRKYVRDSATQKPLLYDLSDGVAKTYDDPTLRDPALEGEYEVQEQKAKPAFEFLKGRAAEFPPERVEEITTIPAKTLRQITREFGKAAEIGATITIDGQELPLRPVAIDWDRGPQGHSHTWHHTWALQLVNIVVGALQVPGGLLGTGAANNFPVRVEPVVGKDGLMDRGHEGEVSHWATHFPGREPVAPARQDLFELFPVAGHSRDVIALSNAEREKYGLTYGLEMLIHASANPFYGQFGGGPLPEQLYKDMKFVVGFARETHELHDVDDLVLPSPTYLERDVFGSANSLDTHSPAGEPEGWHQIHQHVVDMPEGMRDPGAVLTEVYDRLGLLPELNMYLNRSLGLKDSHRLEPDRRYTQAELLERQAVSKYGEEYSWDWFKSHGVLHWDKDLPSRYIGPFAKGRVGMYLEHLIERGEQLVEVTSEMGLEWDVSDYEPVPTWSPCHSFGMLRQGEIDAIGIHYKLPFAYGAFGAANGWVNELLEKTDGYAVRIHEDLARRKGIRDGDDVWLESEVEKVKAVAKVTQCVHPEVVGIAGHFGAQAKGLPLAKGKGVAFNRLLTYDMDHIDRLTAAIDHCAPLKVYKA